MASGGAAPFGDRIGMLRNDLAGAGLDGFVITHLPNLRYMTGFSGTAGAALVTPDRCTLVVDFRYATAAREVLASHPDGLVHLALVDRTYDETLTDLLRRPEPSRIGIEGSSMTVTRFERLSNLLASPDRGGVSGAVSLVATDRVAFLREGRSELAVAADIDAAIRDAGFERPAFDTIVASGVNSARPHAVPGPRTLEAGDGVVLDFGGIYDGYCVDLTRTLHIGRPAPELLRLSGAVREAHGAAIAAVRPGARPSEIDAAARNVLARHGLADAFGHGTGHGLGLEVHEDPRISKLSGAFPDDPVVAGMVFTIEPGAYVDGLGGVRIEDDVLVTSEGCDLLTDVPIED
jgi:Xaa-Pro aminopeptidase